MCDDTPNEERVDGDGIVPEADALHRTPV